MKKHLMRKEYRSRGAATYLLHYCSVVHEDGEFLGFAERHGMLPLLLPPHVTCYHVTKRRVQSQ